MGVHQFLSWLRARHPQAFRTSRKLRSVEEETFKKEFFKEEDSSSSSSSSSSDSDSDDSSSSSSSSSSNNNKNQQQQTQNASKKKKTLSGSEDDYAVICLDINALLHEVATAVTTQGQTPGASSSSTSSSRIQLLNKGTVEQEILIRLRKQIEDLIFVAGGDTLKLQQQQLSKNTRSQEQIPESSLGVLTFDNLEEIPSNVSNGKKKNEDDEVEKTASFNGHNFRLFDSSSNNNTNPDSAVGTSSSSSSSPLPIEEQNLLPVDILLVIDGVAPVGKCPQQRERRATRKQPGTVQEKAQQMLIQAAEKRSGRLEAIFSNTSDGHHHHNKNNRKENANLQLDDEITSSSTAFSLYSGDMSSNAALASGASSVWDGNAITVGTPFMQQVCALLHYVGGALVKLYRNLRVFVSDASVPGEGEQKIFSALRSGMLSTIPLSYTTTLSNNTNNNTISKQMQNSINADENRRICVCSNDTDSIVMALLLSDEDLVKRQIDVWRTPSIQLFNLAAATALQMAVSGSSASPTAGGASSLAVLQQQQQNATAWIFDMSIFIRDMKKAFDWREDISELISQIEKKSTTTTSTTNSTNKSNTYKETTSSNNNNANYSTTTDKITEIKKRTFGGAMKSFAFMLSLFGGDFLPRVADLSIAEGDLDDVIEVLSEELFVKDKWIVDPLTGVVNLQSMYLVLQTLNERKYGLNVVDNNNRTDAASTGGVRRTRTGGNSSGSGLSLVMGGGSDDSSTFNPFAAAPSKTESASSSSISSDPPPRHLVSFWEGIVWVGRYFDGVIISWSWFFEAGTGTFTSAFNTHHSAPRLKDLVKYPHAYLGKPVEMAATAAQMFQEQVEIFQRGLGGQYLATKQQKVLSLLQQNNKTSTTSSNIPSENLCRKINTSQISSSVAKVLQQQQDQDLFADVNPIAFAAIVLPYYSWANLLPRALGEELLLAYDRARSLSLEEEKREQEQDESDPHFIEESEKLLDLKSDYASIGSTPSEIEEKNAKLAKLFIRQIRNLKGFNPVKAISSVMKLVINLKHRFTVEEQKLLSKREMYKLGWARVVVGNNNNVDNDTNQKNNKVLDEDEIGNLNLGNNKNNISLKQHEQLFRNMILRMNPSNSEIAKLWQENIMNGSNNNTLTMTDIFALHHNSKNTENEDDDEALSFLKSFDQEKVVSEMKSLMNKNNDNSSLSSLLPSNLLDNISTLVSSAEEAGKKEIEKMKKQEQEKKNSNGNNVDQDAAIIINSSSSKEISNNKTTKRTTLTERIGNLHLPSNVKFSGIYSHHASSSSATTLSASLLASFPTLSNSFVPASKGGVAVMLEETVTII